MRTAARPNAFALPAGTPGRVAGWLMAFGNADMERAAIKALRLEGDERVLEIGYGPGVGVRYLMRKLRWGYAAGVDPSEVMRRQALRRNRRTVRSGLVDLRIGDASHLPWPDGRFDAAVSVNNVMLWDPLEASAAEIHRVLKDDAKLSIAVHAWAVEPGFERRIATVLRDAGFGCVKTRLGRSRSGGAYFVTARRS